MTLLMAELLTILTIVIAIAVISNIPRKEINDD
jgi:hypothetical protein